jgi:hypothetical protein
VPLAVITDYMGDDTSLEVELFREAGVDAFVAPGPERAAGWGWPRRRMRSSPVMRRSRRRRSHV